MSKKPTTAPTAAEPRPPSVPASLQQIRSDHLRARHDTSTTINRLEEWRDELDATIAFLKAQKK